MSSFILFPSAATLFGYKQARLKIGPFITSLACKDRPLIKHYTHTNTSRLKIWCEWSGSNRHDCNNRQILSLMRLPISPHSHNSLIRPPFGDLCWIHSRTGHNRSGLARPCRLWGAPLKGPATTLYNVFGGTDGARTRDLWRDRPAL